MADAPVKTTIIKDLSREEWAQMFDQVARELLGISGAEFIRHYEKGDYADQLDDPNHPEIMHLVMLRPT